MAFSTETHLRIRGLKKKKLTSSRSAGAGAYREEKGEEFVGGKPSMKCRSLGRQQKTSIGPGGKK